MVSVIFGVYDYFVLVICEVVFFDLLLDIWVGIGNFGDLYWIVDLFGMSRIVGIVVFGWIEIVFFWVLYVIIIGIEDFVIF